MATTMIFLDEEYGYRYWLWTFPGTIEEAIEYWKSLPSFDCIIMRTGDLKGEVERLDDDEVFARVPYYGCDVRAHLHEDEDSYLSYGDETYVHQGYKPWDTD